MREARCTGAIGLRKFDNFYNLDLGLWLNDDWDYVKSSHFL